MHTEVGDGYLRPVCVLPVVLLVAASWLFLGNAHWSVYLPKISMTICCFLHLPKVPTKGPLGTAPTGHSPESFEPCGMLLPTFPDFSLKSWWMSLWSHNCCILCTRRTMFRWTLRSVIFTTHLNKAAVPLRSSAGRKLDSEAVPVSCLSHSNGERNLLSVGLGHLGVLIPNNIVEGLQCPCTSGLKISM